MRTLRLAVLLFAPLAGATTPRTEWPCGAREAKWVEAASVPLRKEFKGHALAPRCVCGDAQCKGHRVDFKVNVTEEPGFEAWVDLHRTTPTTREPHERLAYLVPAAGRVRQHPLGRAMAAAGPVKCETLVNGDLLVTRCDLGTARVGFDEPSKKGPEGDWVPQPMIVNHYNRFPARVLQAAEEPLFAMAAKDERVAKFLATNPDSAVDLYEGRMSLVSGEARLFVGLHRDRTLGWRAMPYAVKAVCDAPEDSDCF